MRQVLLLAAALLAGCGALSRRVPPQDPAVLYYSDLGPAEIDVAAYPEDRRRQYAVYARVCSACHTLARSVNSPVVSRDFWEMYILAMRRRSAWTPTPEITRQEGEAVADFLDYDARVRKIERAAEFDALTRALKRRYAELPRPSTR
jgi:hypothetical protein